MSDAGLEVTVRHRSGVAICDFKGLLRSGPGEDMVRTTLNDLFDRGERRIVVNLEQVPRADSAALGELVAAYASITRRGGAVRLLRPAPRMLHLLEITGLNTVFDVFSDEEEAIRTFRASSAAHNAQSLGNYLE